MYKDGYLPLNPEYTLWLTCYLKWNAIPSNCYSRGWIGIPIPRPVVVVTAAAAP